MKMLMIVILALMLMVQPAVSLDTPALCDMVDLTSHGEAMVWDNVRKAYPGTPNDLYYLETLYLDDPETTDMHDVRAYLMFYSRQTQELWIFPMWSMVTAPNNEAPGYTCAPRRYRLDE